MSAKVWVRTPRNRRFLFGASAFLVVGFGVGALVAGVPTRDALHYMGHMNRRDGSPVSGTHDIELYFWDAPTDGAKRCTTVASRTLVSAGFFRLPLASECVEAVRNKVNLWVEVRVNQDSLGRTKIGATPYALEAARTTEAAGTLKQATSDLVTAIAAAENKRRAHVLSVPAAAFVNEHFDDSEEWAYADGARFLRGGIADGVVSAIAPLHFPQGAVLNMVRCHWVDEDPTRPLSAIVLLTKTNIQSGIGLWIQNFSFDSRAEDAESRVHESTSAYMEERVDNTAFTYELELANFFVGTDGRNNRAGLRWYGCTIEYTL